MNVISSRPGAAALLFLACCIALVPLVTAACNDFTMDFTYDPPNPIRDGPLYPVNFSGTLTPATGQEIRQLEWDFGDGIKSGSASSAIPHVITNQHNYHSDGSFTVILTAKSSCGKTETKSKSISLRCTDAVTGFSVDKVEGNAPLTVHITDTSQHTPDSVTTWEYKKDGTRFSTERNPVITFPSAGTYHISQTIKKSCSPAPASTTSRTITVKPALLMVQGMNLSGVTVSGTTTTVTTTVTTTTTAAPAPVVPSYSDTTFAGAAPAAATAVQTPVETVTAPQQTTASWSSPTVSQAPQPPGTTAPVTAAPGTGTLSVKTEPAGAKIWVDDVMRGMSPASIPELAAGPHTLRLEKAGYQNMTVPVSIGDGKVTEYSTSLEAESGGLGIVPIVAVVVVIAAVAGGAYWYLRKKGTGTGGQH
jgi:PKD repeat protein